jgi:hypothetical protein
MKQILKNYLIAIVIAALIIAGFNNGILAASINLEIANIGYWYSDDDIREVIKNRLGDKAYIAPAVPNVPALIHDVATAAVNEAKSGKPALILVNLGGNHWTGIAIRAKANGDLVVFYNDSFGSPIVGSFSESGQYIAAIKQILPNVEVIDLQVQQQNDGSSCGAFTAENLILLSSLDQANLTPEAAVIELGKINDAAAIRLKQLSEYPMLVQEIANTELIANSIILRNNVEVVSNMILSELSNLVNTTTDRLSHLYLADNDSTGFSAGDEELNYGVWTGGTIGNGVFFSKFKQNSAGGTIGFDGKIDEDTVLGITVIHNLSNLKPKFPVRSNFMS